MIGFNFDLMVAFVANVFNSIYSQGENITRSPPGPCITLEPAVDLMSLLLC